MMHLHNTCRETYFGALFYFTITGIYRTDPPNNNLKYRHTRFQGLPQHAHIPMVWHL